MGGFAGGFLGSFTDEAKQKIDQHHEEEQQRNKELRSGLWKIAYDTTGQYNDATKQNAREQLEKLYGPQGKKGLQKVTDIVSRLTGQLPTPQGAAQPQQPQGASQTPQQAQSPAPVLPAGAPKSPTEPTPAAVSPPVQSKLPVPQAAAPPKTSFSLPPVATQDDLDAAEARKGQVDRDRRKKAADEAGLKGAQRVGFIEHGTISPNLEKQSALDQLAEAIKATDPDMTDEDAKAHAGKIIQDQATKKGAPTQANMQLGWMHYPGDKEGAPPHAVRIDPKDPSKKLDQDSGKPVPEGASTVDQAEVLAKMRQNSYGQMGDLQRAVRGEHPDWTPDQVAGEAARRFDEKWEKQVALIGAGKITEAYGIGGTQTHVVPTSPAAKPQAAAPSTGTPPSATAPPQSGPVVVSPKSNPKLPSPPVASTATGDQSDPILPGISIAQARIAGQQAAPVAAAVTEIYGDPRQPNMHPLQSYADLADNKKSQERIGKAIQLTLNGFGDGIKEASIGAGVGPVHLSAGGWGTWLDNKLKGPQAAAGAQADTLRNVINEMTPEEKDAYDSTMATMSTMAGLRSISRQSAAMGSIQLIEREIPKIGLNATNSRQFYDQLQRTAAAIATYANTPLLFPRVRDPHTGSANRLGFTPEMQKRITELTDELQKKKDASSRRTNQKLPTPSDMEQKEYNGDTYERRKGTSDPWKRVKKAA